MKNFLFFIKIIFYFVLINIINCQDSQIDKATEDEIKFYLSINKERKLLSEQKFIQ